MLLADALAVTSSLTAINLHGNDVADVGARAIARALASTNSRVAQLDLTHNRLSAAGIDAVFEVLDALRPLREVHFEFDDDDDDSD